MRTSKPQRFETAKCHVVLLGVCVLALGGCVSQGKYEQLAKERDALAQEKMTLEENVSQERMKLIRTNQELKSIMAMATEKEAMLAAERHKLSATNEELQNIKASAAEQEAMFAKLKNELSSELASHKLTVRQLKNGISVDLPEDILFPSGSSVLRNSGHEVLAKLGEQLKDANYQIVVSGFTDNVPVTGRLAERFPTNWDLAAARATNVVRLLEEKNVPSSKLIAASYGENNPVADNETEEGRKKNRRIEIHLRPVIEE